MLRYLCELLYFLELLVCFCIKQKMCHIYIYIYVTFIMTRRRLNNSPPLLRLVTGIRQHIRHIGRASNQLKANVSLWRGASPA